MADAARRERSALLRTFESSTLTKSNFLVLKRMTEAELDAQLALARQERQASGGVGGEGGGGFQARPVGPALRGAFKPKA